VFGVGVPSDHRLLWIEILVSGLSLKAVDCPMTASVRRLPCCDLCVVRKYLLALKAQCQATNLYQCVEDLSLLIQGDQLTWAQKQEYESIDHAIKNGLATLEPKFNKGY